MLMAARKTLLALLLTTRVWAVPSLFEAARDGDVAALRAALKSGAPVNARHNGVSALWAAVFFNRLATTRLLLEQKADTEIADEDGVTPLLQAAASSDPKILKLLILSGAKVKVVDREGRTALHHCCMGALNLESLKILLKAGADAKKCDRTGTWPLVLICAQDQGPEAAELLLQAGAPVDGPDLEGNTPLMASAFGGFLKHAKVLLRHGASLKIRNKKGKSPLDYAREGGHPEMIKLLTS